MQMRFTIEQRHLTDPGGKPVTGPGVVAFHTCDADNVENAVDAFAKSLGAEVIGEVLKFPGFQAIATIRSATGVFTIQVAPSSQQTLSVP
jgi:hypothetical protein